MRGLLMLVPARWIALATLLVVHTASASPPQRIVSLSPHVTELLYSAGLGDRVVGVSESCDFPEEAKLKPRISGYRGTNVEAVLALKPDLVVSWPGGNRAADVETIARLGITVHASELSTLASITGELRRFSRWSSASATRNNALQQAQAADALMESLRKQYVSARKVSVFYQLGEGRLFTLTDKHVISEALSMCGAENVFGKLALSAPEVSREAVLNARPDAVLVADPSSLLSVRESWRASNLFVAADVRERVAAVDGARLHRPTLRTFAAVKAMCDTINQIRTTLR